MTYTKQREASYPENGCCCFKPMLSHQTKATATTLLNKWPAAQARHASSAHWCTGRGFKSVSGRSLGPRLVVSEEGKGWGTTRQRPEPRTPHMAVSAGGEVRGTERQRPEKRPFLFKSFFTQGRAPGQPLAGWRARLARESRLAGQN